MLEYDRGLCILCMNRIPGQELGSRCWAKCVTSIGSIDGRQNIFSKIYMFTHHLYIFMNHDALWYGFNLIFFFFTFASTNIIIQTCGGPNIIKTHLNLSNLKRLTHNSIVLITLLLNNNPLEKHGLECKPPGRSPLIRPWSQ